MTQSLYPQLRERCRRLLEAEDLDIESMNTQQCGCLYKITPVDIPTWPGAVGGRASWPYCQLKSYSQSWWPSEGEPVFFRDKHTDRLSKPKCSVYTKYMQAALAGRSRFHRHSKTMIITEQEDMDLRGTRGVGSGEEAVDMMKIHPMNF